MKKILIVGLVSLVSFITLLFLVINQEKTSKYNEIEITALGEKNELSKASEVWIKQFDVDNKLVPLYLLQKNGPWEIKGKSLVSYKDQPAKISWKGNARSINLVFINSKWSGKVQIAFNNEKQKIDLYSDTETEKEIALQSNESYHYLQFFYILLMLISVFLLFWSLVKLLYVNSVIFRNILHAVMNKRVLVYAFPPILVFSIYLLAFFPGLMSADSLDQWGQMISFNFNDHHPVFHTHTNWLITRIYLSPASIAIFQILSISLSLGYGMAILEKIV